MKKQFTTRSHNSSRTAHRAKEKEPQNQLLALFVKDDTRKRTLIMLSIVLVWALMYAAVGETIAVNKGFGWDGYAYGALTQRWSFYVEHGALDSYRVVRIFPSVLFYYILTPLLHDSSGMLSAATIVNIYKVYTVLLLCSVVMAWDGISRHLRFNAQAHWIGFIALVGNYAIAKYAFYYSTLIDVTAFTLGIWAVYCYLKQHSILLLVLASVGYFSFPTVFLECALLFCFPYNSAASTQSSIRAFPDKAVQENSLWVTLVCVVAILSLAAIGIVYFVILYPTTFPLTEPIHEPTKYLNIALVLAYTGVITLYAARVFPFVTIGRMLLSWQFWLRVLIVVALNALLWFAIARPLHNPSLPAALKLNVFVGGSFSLAVGKPLVAPIAFAVYFGPAIMLILMCLRQYTQRSAALGAGYCLVTFGTLLLSGIMSETRQLMSLFPVIIVALSFVFATTNTVFSWLRAAIYLSLVIISTKIWLPINFSQMNDDVYVNLTRGYDTFPMQKYFMNHGPWMSMESYIYQAVGCAIIGGILFVLLRKSLFARS